VDLVVLVSNCQQHLEVLLWQVLWEHQVQVLVDSMSQVVVVVLGMLLMILPIEV
tara:strand:+ start:189 stop:350 length:162 start_codon:yes stop_codon:yes gene_type:complete